MAQLRCDSSLKTIILKDTFGSRDYNAAGKRQWGEVQNILSKFGISFPSRDLIYFEGDAYKLRAIPVFFGSGVVEVLYKKTVIGRATIEGSNYCDREAKLTINLSTLRSIYET